MKFNELLMKLYPKKKNLYILLFVGIFILIASNIFTPTKDKNSKESESFVQVYSIENEEKRLENILSKVYGAGKTEVMITYDTGVEKVIVQDSKISESNSTDVEGTGGESKENDTVEEKQTVMNGSGNSQTPFISKEINPRVRGVLVLAEGAGNTKTNYDLTNAVAAVLDVPYYRIQVLKKTK